MQFLGFLVAQLHIFFSFPVTVSMRIGKLVSYCEYDALEKYHLNELCQKVLICEGLWCLRSLPEKHKLRK